MRFTLAAILVALAANSAQARDRRRVKTRTQTICKVGQLRGSEDIFGRVAVNQVKKRNGNETNAVVGQRWKRLEPDTQYQLAVCAGSEDSCCGGGDLLSTPVGNPIFADADGCIFNRSRVEDISVIGDDSVIDQWLVLTRTDSELGTPEGCCQITEKEPKERK